MLDLPKITLAAGGHNTPDEGVCLLEAVAWFAGEKHSDQPACVSEVLGTYGRNLNDVLPDDRRQRLVPLIPRLVGTAGDGLDQPRRYMALDWLTRVHLPALLDMTALTPAAAQKLRDLPPITDEQTAQAAADAATRIKPRIPEGPGYTPQIVYEAGAPAKACLFSPALPRLLPSHVTKAIGATLSRAADAVGPAPREGVVEMVARLQDSAIALYTAMITPGGAA